MKILVSVVAAALCLGPLAAFGAETRIEWACSIAGPAEARCELRNVGADPGDVCLEVVAVCSDGERVAPLCSGTLAPGARIERQLTGFEPPLHAASRCWEVQFRNPRVRLR